MILWVLFVGVIFYFGAKRRQLPTYLWALIGIGSLIGGILLGFGIGYIFTYFSSDMLTVLVIAIVTTIVCVVLTYWIMDEYSYKVNNRQKIDEDLLDKD